MITSESSIEQCLLSRLLCEPSSTSGHPIPRSEEELLSLYEFPNDRDHIRMKYLGYKRVDEYLKLALDCVSKLKNTVMHDQFRDFRADSKRRGGLPQTARSRQ